MRHIFKASGSLLLLLLVIVFGSAESALAADYSKVSYEIADRSEATRGTSMRRGLQEVIVRLMGVREPGQYPAVRDMLRKPERFIQQYQYHSALADQGGDEVLQILMVFDVQAISRVLQEAQLPLWSGARANILVWMAVDEGDARYLIANNTHREVRELMDRIAQSRGISLLFPLYDLQEQKDIQFMDVWGGFFDYLKTASARYADTVILAGRIYKNRLDNDWVGGPWSMQIEDDYSTMEGGKGALLPVLEQVIDELVTRMRQQTLSVAGEITDMSVRMRIEGINQVANYARVIQYLTGLQSVQDVQINALIGDRLELILILQEGINSLEEEIALGTLLDVVSGQEALWYRLRP
ncbi:MAG: DUF2066 domain-containing protein [Gammaproteobacteria bacterium]|nr:DUF2066 domain-containing protein [Gammaproteobacteria bacterium]